MTRTFAIIVATLITALVLGGCAMVPTRPMPSPSLYERLGGVDAIATVVDDIIGNIAADPRINQHFRGAVGSHLRNNLVDLICVRTGGPCVYSGRDMSVAHDGMNIRDDEFNALIEDLVLSLDKFKVPSRERLEVLAIFGQMKNAIIGH